MKQQLGGTILGFIIGVVVGLAAALAVAVYVTKVPVPFLNKGNGRGADLDHRAVRAGGAGDLPAARGSVAGNGPGEPQPHRDLC